MNDHPHLHYSNHSQQEKLKPLNQDFYDVNPTCKLAFLDFGCLSKFSYLYFACHVFSASPFLIFMLLSFLKRCHDDNMQIAG